MWCFLLFSFLFWRPSRRPRQSSRFESSLAKWRTPSWSSVGWDSADFLKKCPLTKSWWHLSTQRQGNGHNVSEGHQIHLVTMILWKQCEPFITLNTGTLYKKGLVGTWRPLFLNLVYKALRNEWLTCPRATKAVDMAVLWPGVAETSSIIYMHSRIHNFRSLYLIESCFCTDFPWINHHFYSILSPLLSKSIGLVHSVDAHSP